MKALPILKASVLIDGQWGSTGKGLLAAYLASRGPIDLATTNASANAGHTTVFENGEKLVCYHLPTSGVLCPHSTVYLNAGSIIDPELLFVEIGSSGISRSRVFIHPNAAVILPEDRATEAARTSGATSIGSTQKGVGAALARKLSRGPLGTIQQAVQEGVVHLPSGVTIKAIPLPDYLERQPPGKGRMLVEVPQGSDLSLNGVFYPYCTSREVSVSQALSDAGLHPHHLGEVIMSLRTYPIRVGHIYDSSGTKIGNSGPGWFDAPETSWEQLGVPAEITTVTKRPRRVFQWSAQQVRKSFSINRPTVVFLNFCNYLKDPGQLKLRVHDIAVAVGDRKVKMLYGFGPKVSDIVEDYGEALERIAR